MEYTIEERKVIIETLRDDEKYYGDFGKQFLSNSNIKQLLEDPTAFGGEFPISQPLIAGRYFHHMLLEPEKIEDYEIINASTRNTKVYKDAVGASSEKILLLQKEVDALRTLGDSLLDHPVTRDLIKPGEYSYEVPGLNNYFGRWFKMKADILNHTDGLIVDVKTTGDINNFRSSASKYNYDSQAYIYSNYFKMDFVFAVACKKSGNIGVFECSPEFLESGKEKVERAVEVYKDIELGLIDTENYIIQETL